MFGPVWAGSRSRAVWLGVDLLTALLVASVVISRFEATLEQLVALAVLMPIMAQHGRHRRQPGRPRHPRPGARPGAEGSLRLLFLGEMGVSAINGWLWRSSAAWSSPRWATRCSAPSSARPS